MGLWIGIVIMTTLYITHPVFLDHDTGPGHPETADRLRAVNTILETPAFHYLVRENAPAVDPALVEAVHTPAYVRGVLQAIPESGRAVVDDGDTVVSPASGEAALRAAGAVVEGVAAVVGGTTRNVFCGVRPPGHHAEADHAMGFCLFNNVAVAARAARNVHGLERVAVVDFDVHHGNGTQQAFWSDPGVFYASSHQMPLFPGTGTPAERGAHDNIVNVPLASDADSAAFRAAYTETILPRLRAFAPQLVLISAGFDAHKADPLATVRVSTADFGWLTGELLAVARDCADNRVVSVLEGGYNLNALAASVAAHVRALLEA